MSLAMLGDLNRRVGDGAREEQVSGGDGVEYVSEVDDGGFGVEGSTCDRDIGVRKIVGLIGPIPGGWFGIRLVMAPLT